MLPGSRPDAGSMRLASEGPMISNSFLAARHAQRHVGVSSGAEIPVFQPGRSSFEGPLREAGGLIEALDWLDQGMMILDGESRILFANAYARDILANGRGALFILEGRLHARGRADGAILRSLIVRCKDRTMNGQSPTILPQPFRLGSPPLFVLAAPLTVCAGLSAQGTGCCVLSIVDPARVRVPSERELRFHFGLTATEASVAVHVLCGDGLKAAARRLGISVETVRSHLRHIFDKTGVKRQAELVRLLLSSCHVIRGERASHTLVREG